MMVLKQALERLYALAAFVPASWKDRGEHGFLNNTLIERSIALLAPEISGDMIDVGCAVQPYNGYFAHVRRKVNCDIDASRGQVDFTCPADKIPVEDASFDAVLCTEVLEHVPEPIKVWREFHRILRPGGKVLLTTPMYWPAHEVPYDFYRYPEHGLRYLAESNGFEVLAMIPRGGIYAFLGQTFLMAVPQYFPFHLQRRLWFSGALLLDRWRLNPRMTLGWTILARKL